MFTLLINCPSFFQVIVPFYILTSIVCKFWLIYTFLPTFGVNLFNHSWVVGVLHSGYKPFASYILSVFFPNQWLAYLFSWWHFWWTKVFTWMKPNLSFFSFYGYCFLCSKKSLPTSSLQWYNPMFISKIFTVFTFNILVYDPSRKIFG